MNQPGFGGADMDAHDVVNDEDKLNIIDASGKLQNSLMRKGVDEALDDEGPEEDSILEVAQAANELFYDIVYYHFFKVGYLKPPPPLQT